jgi:hypothetical protein
MGTTCHACAYSFMEPSDMTLTCGHKDSGPFGVYTYKATEKDGHCGPNRSKFEQHPKRNSDGSLKRLEVVTVTTEK